MEGAEAHEESAGAQPTPDKEPAARRRKNLESRALQQGKSMDGEQRRRWAARVTGRAGRPAATEPAETMTRGRRDDFGAESGVDWARSRRRLGWTWTAPQIGGG